MCFYQVFCSHLLLICRIADGIHQSQLTCIDIDFHSNPPSTRPFNASIYLCNASISWLQFIVLLSSYFWH